MKNSIFYISGIVVVVGCYTLIVTGFENFANGIDCGITPLMDKPERTGKIIGGNKARPEEIPWIASVRKTTPTFHVCGGIIFHQKFVLTAAHCLYEDNGKKRLSPKNFYVGLGEYDIDKNDEKIIQVEKYFIHKEFSDSKFRKTKGYISPDMKDIALLKLKENIEWNEKVKPICLSTEEDYNQKVANVAGWGTVKTSNPWPYQYLQQVELDIWNQNECKKKAEKVKWKYYINDHHLCAARDYKDSCTGDSGGPLYIHENNRTIAIGIVSHGFKCAMPGFPGIYSKVSFFINWIKKKIEEESPKESIMLQNILYK